MRLRKVIFSITFAAVCILSAGCTRKTTDVNQNTETPSQVVTPLPTATPTATPSPEPTRKPTTTVVEKSEWFKNQLNSIMKDNPQYKDYVMEQYEFGDVYAVTFQPPEATKDFMEYYCDLWLVGENQITKIFEGNYVNYDCFETGRIGDIPYFRYDLSYPSESCSVLLMMDEENQLHQVSLGGALAKVEGKDLTITVSSYDMCYIKEDAYLCGHTWKPHYYFMKDYDVYEYPSVVMEKSEFLDYKGASELLNQLKGKYSNSDEDLSIEFLSYANGLIIANIVLDSDDAFTYFYETYQVNTDGTLENVDSGEGTYTDLMFDETP